MALRNALETVRGAPETLSSAGLPLAVTALTAATVVPTLDGGGFSGTAQWVFAGLAGLALLGAAYARVADTKKLSAVTLALAALAGLSILSATWTVGDPGEALRAGATSAGLAAVTFAAAILSRRAGAWPVVASVAILALVEALVGLHAVAAHALPSAERIAGGWRPGGTFEYPPALALLQVAALPVLCGLLGRRARSLAGMAAVGGAAAGVVLGGAVLGVADSRLATALALLVLAFGLACPAVGASTRSSAIGVAILAAAGATVSRVLLHARTGAVGQGSGMAAYAGLITLALLLGAAWTLVGSLQPLRARRNAIAGATVAMCAGIFLFVSPVGRQAHSLASLHHRATLDRAAASPVRSDWLHGRAKQWEVAIETWLDRPWLGAGAGAYFRASLRHQDTGATLYAHDLPLEDAAELGVTGLLLAIVLYMATGWTLVRARRSPAAWLLGPLSLIFLASNLVDWTWHLAGLSALWAAAVGTLHGQAGVETHHGQGVAYGARRASAMERTATGVGPGC